MKTQLHFPATLLDHIAEALAFQGSSGEAIYVNRAFKQWCGFLPDGPVNGEERRLKDVLSQAFAAGEGNWEGELPSPDGGKFATLAIHRLPGDTPSPAAIAVVSTAAERFLTALDPVTGLAQRPFLQDRIDHTVRAQKRHGGSVVLMILGVDHFTMVNDAMGMAAGDAVLAIVADRIRTCLRDSDSAVRLDGDKFALLLTVTHPDDVIIVAEKVLAITREPYFLGTQEVVLTASIGIASFPADGQDSHELVQMAENSLHHAKEAGRNQYQFFSKDMNGKAMSKLGIAARVRKGIANGEFVPFYQPKVRTDDHAIVGAEALARWTDPEIGLVMPCDFIPIAEETGLIEEIGKRILVESCIQTRKWQDKGYDPVVISVNVSPRQFRNARLIATVAEALTQSGLDPQWLELEITESVIMQDLEASTRKMLALRDMGIGLSIDDFGVGYSSMSYLSRFPLTALKIDRAFISDVNSNPKTAEIARAIIGLSKGLKLDVVAEGCEIPEHLRFLKENGCDAIQGFYFSRPVPAKEFEAMLRAGMVYPVPSSLHG